MSSFSSFEKDKKRFDDWRLFLLKEQREDVREGAGAWLQSLFGKKDSPGDEEADARSAADLLGKFKVFLDSLVAAIKAFSGDEEEMKKLVHNLLQEAGLGDFANKLSVNLDVYNNFRERIENGKATYSDFIDFIQDMTTYLVNKPAIDEILKMITDELAKLLSGKEWLKKIPIFGWIVEVADIGSKLIVGYNLAKGLGTGSEEDLKGMIFRPDGSDSHSMLKYLNMNDSYENAFGSNENLMNNFVMYFHKMKRVLATKGDETLPEDFIDQKFKKYLEKHADEVGVKLAAEPVK